MLWKIRVKLYQIKQTFKKNGKRANGNKDENHEYEKKNFLQEFYLKKAITCNELPLNTTKMMVVLFKFSKN